VAQHYEYAAGIAPHSKHDAPPTDYTPEAQADVVTEGADILLNAYRARFSAPATFSDEVTP
jgi:hypothetical protein